MRPTGQDQPGYVDLQSVAENVRANLKAELFRLQTELIPGTSESLVSNGCITYRDVYVQLVGRHVGELPPHARLQETFTGQLQVAKERRVRNDKGRQRWYGR